MTQTIELNSYVVNTTSSVPNGTIDVMVDTTGMTADMMKHAIRDYLMRGFQQELRTLKNAGGSEWQKVLSARKMTYPVAKMMAPKMEPRRAAGTREPTRDDVIRMLANMTPAARAAFIASFDNLGALVPGTTEE